MPALQPEVISEAALAAVTSSTAIFSGCPAKTELIMLTIRGGTLSVRFDAGTATATNGIDYPAGTYAFHLTENLAKNVRAIGASVTSGYISYQKPLGR